jgi:hypothetical protein
MCRGLQCGGEQEHGQRCARWVDHDRSKAIGGVPCNISIHNVMQEVRSWSSAGVSR